MGGFQMNARKLYRECAMANKARLMGDWLRVASLAALASLALPSGEVLAATLGGSSGGGFAAVAEEFLYSQLYYLPNFIAAVCFVGGILAMVSGVLKLKEHAENPSQHKMGPGIARMFAGSALVSLPSFVGWVWDTSSLGGGAYVSFMGFNSGMSSWTPGG
jgi:hypothetical protein